MKLTTIRPIVGSTMSLYIFDDGVEYIHAGELQIEIGYSPKSSALRTLDRFGLEKIEVDKLSFSDKERYEKVRDLMGYLKTIKVVDAPVLLKIYNLYRCSL